MAEAQTPRGYPLIIKLLGLVILLSVIVTTVLTVYLSNLEVKSQPSLTFLEWPSSPPSELDLLTAMTYCEPPAKKLPNKQADLTRFSTKLTTAYKETLGASIEPFYTQCPRLLTEHFQNSFELPQENLACIPAVFGYTQAEADQMFNPNRTFTSCAGEQSQFLFVDDK